MLKIIENYDGAYAVDECGIVYSRKNGPHGLCETWTPLKWCFDAAGYPVVGLYKDGVSRLHYVHVLTAHAWLGRPDDPKLWVLHKNDCKTDARIENLYFGTPKQNKEDAARNGRIAMGERHGRAKLTEACVRDIRSRASAGEKLVSIAADYDIHQTTVGQIVRKTVWRHVS